MGLRICSRNPWYVQMNLMKAGMMMIRVQRVIKEATTISGLTYTERSGRCCWSG